jgi:hypothetical protein
MLLSLKSDNSLLLISDYLKSNGVRKIVLFGPFPHWPTTLPDLINDAINRNGRDYLPLRIKIPENPTFFEYKII